jgi:transposase
MARAYSNDLRRKVLWAYAAGKGTMRGLAERFDASYGWVLKIAAAQRRSGSYKRAPRRRAPSRIYAELIRRLVEAQPDIVLVELQQKAAEQGVRASTVHMWRILAKLGL